MKKIIIVIFTLMVVKGFSGNGTNYLYAAPTWTKVVKSDGGLFGYKHVDQNTGATSGNSTLACSDPGFNRCRFTPIDIVVGGNGNLTEEDFIKIDALVNSSINSDNLLGELTYSSYTIKYKYNENTNKIKY